MEKDYLGLINMKEKVVIVVEGKTDIDVLSKLTDAILVSTNGSDIPRETLKYIEELSHSYKVIILTDPDYPGLRIREKVTSVVPNAYQAYVDRSKASNGKKLGVAETQIDEIIRALKDAKCYSKTNDIKYDYTISDMYELGLCGKDNSSYLRDKVYEHYNLGFGSSKTLMKRLSVLNIDKEELRKFIGGINNDNCK
jgi:ribonuclease M5